MVSVGLIAFAVGYYFFAGQSLKEVATGSVLFAFAIFMAAVRNGVGRTGVYIDGVRYAWSKVDAARVAKDHGNPVVTFRIKDIERPIRLPVAMPKRSLSLWARWGSLTASIPSRAFALRLRALRALARLVPRLLFLTYAWYGPP